MDEQRRYNLVTREGAEGAIAGNQAISNLRTVFSSAVAEISGQLGNELAPDIRRLTDDLADWFKGAASGVLSLSCVTIFIRGVELWSWRGFCWQNCLCAG
ncbi:hypothetical protein DKG79_01860 [Escherichia fergusonii]|nr:hypothetical protein DKG79_01860 [Escherichia fergusonii]